MSNALRAVLCLVHPISREEWRVVLRYLASRGMELAGIAPTFRAAEDMKDAGEADLIVTDSSDNLPMDLVIISRELQVMEWHADRARQRPRRLRRPGRRSAEE